MCLLCVRDLIIKRLKYELYFREIKVIVYEIVMLIRKYIDVTEYL